LAETIFKPREAIMASRLQRIENNTRSAADAAWVSIGLNAYYHKRNMQAHREAQAARDKALVSAWTGRYENWRVNEEGKHYASWFAHADELANEVEAINQQWNDIRLRYFKTLEQNQTVTDAIELLNGGQIKAPKKISAWLWILAALVFGYIVMESPLSGVIDGISHHLLIVGQLVSPFALAFYSIFLFPTVVKSLVNSKRSSNHQKRVTNAFQLLNETEWAVGAENIAFPSFVDSTIPRPPVNFYTIAQIDSWNSQIPKMRKSIPGHLDLSIEIAGLKASPELL
jgi:hypothetical protein